MLLALGCAGCKVMCPYSRWGYPGQTQLSAAHSWRGGLAYTPLGNSGDKLRTPCPVHAQLRSRCRCLFLCVCAQFTQFIIHAKILYTHTDARTIYRYSYMHRHRRYAAYKSVHFVAAMVAAAGAQPGRSQRTLTVIAAM